MKTTTFLLLSALLFLLTACQKEEPMTMKPLPNFVQMDWNGTSIEHKPEGNGSGYNAALEMYHSQLAVVENNKTKVFTLNFYRKNKKVSHTDLEALIGEKISLEDCGDDCIEAIISYNDGEKEFHSGNVASNPLPAKYVTITSVTSHSYYPNNNYHIVEGEFESEFTHVDNATQVVTPSTAKDGKFRLAFPE